jgi:hypothetical protein
MPRCAFFTGKFTQCTHNTQRADHTYCGVHTAKAHRMIQRVGPVPEGGCPCVVGTHWCGRALQEGQPICGVHIQRRDEQAAHVVERRERGRERNRLVDEYMLQVPRPDWRDVVDDVQVRMNLPHGAEGRLERMLAYTTARRFFLLTTDPTVRIEVLMHYWVGEPMEFNLNDILGLPPAAPVAPAAPVGVLGGLAADTQSVHREVVVKQTNTNTEILLEASEEAAEDFDHVVAADAEPTDVQHLLPGHTGHPLLVHAEDVQGGVGLAVQAGLHGRGVQNLRCRGPGAQVRACEAPLGGVHGVGGHVLRGTHRPVGERVRRL